MRQVITIDGGRIFVIKVQAEYQHVLTADKRIVRMRYWNNVIEKDNSFKANNLIQYGYILNMIHTYD